MAIEQTKRADRLWVHHAFLLPTTEDQSLFGSKSRRRLATSAAFKYTNTSLGGNFAINNPPQFTHFADIRQPGRGRSEEEWAEGMGRYYSEAIDDPKQVIHMSFGVPRYSSVLSFFSNFYDVNAARLANTGRTSDAWYKIGLIGGYIVSLPLQPFIIGFSATSRVYDFLSKSQPSKWYYFKPTMYSYWSAVNTIANELAIGMGIIPRVFGKADEDDRNELQDPGRRVTTEDISLMHRMYPSIFREEGGIDVMALSRRTERMAYHAQERMREIAESASNINEYRTNVTEFMLNEQPVDEFPNSNSRDKFFDYIRADAANQSTGEVSDLDGTDSFSTWGDLQGIYSFITSSQRDGSQFATFRVNHNGSVSESFSNSVRDSDIAQELNTKISQSRSASYTVMGGNITNSIGWLVDSISSFAAGALDSVNLGGIATLAGTAFVDVPKHWDGSTADLPKAQYTIPLYSPYGNKISRYINLMVPIAMALAGALPLSAGRSAYTSPFICQIYHQGRIQCQLGMIDSLTLTRGTGNVGWNAEGDMLGAELTISVVDLSSIMHIPIKGGFMSGDPVADVGKAVANTAGEAIGGETGLNIAAALTNSSVWDEQSAFQDYMSTLASMSLADSYYVGNRLAINLTRATTAFRTWRSPSNFMSWALDGQPARVVSAFAQYSERL